MDVNTGVNPSTKPRALASVRRVLLVPPPVKYIIYTGSIGKRQGDIKVMIP